MSVFFTSPYPAFTRKNLPFTIIRFNSCVPLSIFAVTICDKQPFIPELSQQKVVTMKRLFTLLFILACGIAVQAQSPNAFNYQAVVRDAEGDILANAEVTFRMSILENTAEGSAVYVETHTVNTNGYGLVNFQIGNGTVQEGDFTAIEWGTKLYFLLIDMDINGGNDFKEMAVQQLIAVPYALHANTVTNSDNDETNELQTLTQDGKEVTLSNGGGTISVADDDSDPTNEIQDITANGENISLTGSQESISLSDLGHWTKENADLYYIRGNVAVGTQLPQHDLNLVGDSAIFNMGPEGSAFNKPAAGILRFSEAGDYQYGLCGFQFNHNGATNKLSLEGGCMNVLDTLITFKRTGGIGINTYDPLYPLHVNGDLGVSEYIRHAGDNNTSVAFGDDQIMLTAGGKRMIHMVEAAADTVKIGDGSDVDINLNDNVFINHGTQTAAFFTQAPSDLFSIYSYSQKRGGINSYLRYTGSGDVTGLRSGIDFYGTDGRCYGQFVEVQKSGSSSSTMPVYGIGMDIDNWGDGATYGINQEVVSSGTYHMPVYGIYVQGMDYQNGTNGDRYSYGIWAKGVTYHTTGTSHTKGIYASYSGSGETEYAGYFAGSVYTTGSYLPSDRMLKTNLTAHSSSLDKVLAIKVYEYSYDTLKYEHMNLPSGMQTGFIAQEFSTVFPELTTTAVQAPLTEEELKTYEEMGMEVPEGGKAQVSFTAVNYAGMVPHLTCAIQEQQQTIATTQEQLATQQQMIEELTRQLAELTARLAAMESTNTGE